MLIARRKFLCVVYVLESACVRLCGRVGDRKFRVLRGGCLQPENTNTSEGDDKSMIIRA